MDSMSVTLEVSKLSGWLNAFAYCRESKGGHAVRGEVRAGRREAAGDRGPRSVQGRARLQIWGRARGGAHPEHAVHARDAGGVEAQWLVERRRVLPRVERRAYGVRGELRRGRWRATLQAACRGGIVCRFGEGHGEERAWNMLLMSVTLEVSKLSDWLNADVDCPCRKEGIQCGTRVQAS